MPHGRHIYAKAYDMARATMCEYSQSYKFQYTFPVCIEICAKFPSIHLPDQEIDDQYPDTSPVVRLHIYCLIARCTKHGRLPITDKKMCRKCQQGNDSVQSTNIYTRK